MLNLSIKDPASLSRICNALSTQLRIQILTLIENEQLSGVEIARRLNCSVSTIAANIKVLEDAGLVISQLRAAKKGSMKICTPVYRDVLIRLQLSPLKPEPAGHYVVDIPVGSYMDCEAHPSCGLYSPDGVIGQEDDPMSFYLPNRADAQMLWLRKGYVEYKVPHNAALSERVTAVEFCMELCSEAPGFNNIWRSDIALWLNEKPAGVWTSPGDFGDRRGRLMPDFWRDGTTQYGLLTTWRVDEGGTYINGEYAAPVNLKDLKLAKKPYITLRLGFPPDNKNPGGFNLFGRSFGDYDQNIVMTVYHE